MILITGDKGFIGSHLAREYSDSEGIDLKSGQDMTLEFGLDYEEIDTVYHLAAESTIEAGFQNNVTITKNLLDALANRFQGDFIFASSSAVYGKDFKPTVESWPSFPISDYGASKVACEALISVFSYEYDFEAKYVRMANVVGKGCHGIIPDIISKIKTNPKEITIIGDGTQTKSYVHIEDCLSAFHYLNNSPGGIYNLGSDDQISVKAIIREIANQMEVDPIIHPSPFAKGDVTNMLLDCTKLKSSGWRPKYSSKEAVRKAISENLQ